MGTYISIPYVTRRSVHIEPSKPNITVDNTVAPLVCDEVKKEEVKEVTKDEDKEKVEEESKEKVAIKEEAKDAVKEEVKDKEVAVAVKEEVKDKEVAVAVKEEVKDKEVAVAEQVIPELLPKRLSITIPSERELLPDLSEKVVEAPRIPEFQGNMNSASHAIKKFNRRHRKHQN